MKKKYVYWMISFLFSFIGFYVIENVFTIKPDVFSGNGNLGILIIILFTPIFIVSYLLTFKLVREKLSDVKNRKLNVAIFLISFLLCGMLIIANIHFAKELFISLEGLPTNPKSKIYRFGWFNQYTNSLYFNHFTFFLPYLMIVIVSQLSIYRKLDKK